MNNRGVIFDLDGTLLDSLPGIAAAANSILTEMGYAVHPLASYRYFVGDGIVELIKRILPADWQETGAGQGEKDKERFLERMVTGYRAFYAELWPQGTALYPGIAELLKELRDKKIKMGILSNKSDDFTRVMVSRLMGEFGFAEVRGACPGVPTKPAPDVPLEMAALMNQAPGETIFMGDSDIDMQTGVNAGMVPVGVLWGFREAPELLANGAKTLLRRPADLLPLLFH